MSITVGEICAGYGGVGLGLGRPAPAPTEPSTTGGRRLSAGFVEWMMGLPHGWVTAVPGVSRSRQLRLLGNGLLASGEES